VIEAAEAGRSMEIALDLLDEVLRARGLLAPQAPEVVARPRTPEPIPRRYAAYAGYYVPLRRVEFDFQENRVRLVTLEAGEEARTSELYYHDGSFFSKDGQPLNFLTVEGQDFLVATPPALGVDMVLGQRVRKPEDPKSLRVDPDGKTWLVRNNRWFDGVQGTQGHVLRSRVLQDLPGHLDFGGLLRVESPDFAAMPVDNIRDLSELHLLEREGSTWARLSEILLSPASLALPLNTGATTLTIGPDGLSQWRVVPEGRVLDFTLPADSRFLVFAPDGKPIYDSMLDSGPLWVDPGTLVEFLSEPGARGRIEAH